MEGTQKGGSMVATKTFSADIKLSEKHKAFKVVINGVEKVPLFFYFDEAADYIKRQVTIYFRPYEDKMQKLLVEGKAEATCKLGEHL